MLTSSTNFLSLDLSSADKDAILKVYMNALHIIFTMYTPILAICFLASLFIKDSGVAARDERGDSSQQVQVQARVPVDSTGNLGATEQEGIEMVPVVATARTS